MVCLQSINEYQYCHLSATVGIAVRHYAAHGFTTGRPMISCVMSEGRLFGLTPSDWSVSLGSFALCGLLTLLV